MTTTEFKTGIIALACWRAAQGELHQVMLAVCQVFINRAAAGWYDGDLYEVAWRWLYENSGEFPDPREPQFQNLINRIDSLIVIGGVSDKTGGALYFARTSELSEKIAGAITTTIGGLTFVK